ncbi:MAG TPA: hypothetical protein VMU81_24305 [Acetobacteraceae bacterium]|nr:hypothetical protein [Acetobacteraceae bacterium]
MDEVFIPIQGVQHYHWRAVDQNGVELDIWFRPDATPTLYWLGENGAGQAVRQRERLQALVKAVACVLQHAAQPAGRKQRAGAAVVAEAFHHRLVGLELSHQRSQPHRLRRHRQSDAAAGAACGAGEAEGWVARFERYCLAG